MGRDVYTSTEYPPEFIISMCITSKIPLLRSTSSANAANAEASRRRMLVSEKLVDLVGNALRVPEMSPGVIYHVGFLQA